MTVRMITLMFLEADFMVRKDRVNIRGRAPFFLEFVATPRADVMARIDQFCLHGQEGILHFPSQSDLLFVTQTSLSYRFRRFHIVGFEGVSLYDLLSAD
jgi:hypothetical protein